MRVVGGKFRGHRFSTPKNFNSRPTTDYAKEALFNILENQYEIEDAIVLDIFSGTGSISLEFLSRGAGKVVSVDIDRASYFNAKEIKKKLEIDNWDIYQTEVFKGVKKVKEKCNIVFADPPFDFKKILEIPNLVFDAGVLVEGGLLIVEHGKQTDFSKSDNYVETRNYGGVNFSFFHVP